MPRSRIIVAPHIPSWFDMLGIYRLSTRLNDLHSTLAPVIPPRRPQEECYGFPGLNTTGGLERSLPAEMRDEIFDNLVQDTK